MVRYATIVGVVISLAAVDARAQCIATNCVCANWTGSGSFEVTVVELVDATARIRIDRIHADHVNLRTGDIVETRAPAGTVVGDRFVAVGVESRDFDVVPGLVMDLRLASDDRIHCERRIGAFSLTVAQTVDALSDTDCYGFTAQLGIPEPECNDTESPWPFGCTTGGVTALALAALFLRRRRRR